MLLKRSLVVWIVLLLLAVAAGAFVVTNRAWLGSVAAESVLSTLLGGVPVSVTDVAIVEGRQLKLKDVVIDGGLSIEEAVVTYDLADLLARRVDPLASVVRIDLLGLRGSQSQLTELAESILRGRAKPRGDSKATRPNGRAGATSAASEGGPRAPVGLIDCVIVTDGAGPLRISRAEIRLDGDTLYVEGADVALESVSLAGSALIDLSAPLDSRAVSVASIDFRAWLVDDLELGGRLSLDAMAADQLRLRATSPDGKAEIEFAGELEAALHEGKPQVKATGEVKIAELDWGSVSVRDWTMGADVDYTDGAATAVVRGGRTDLDRVLNTLAASPAANQIAEWASKAHGWINWNLHLRADRRGAVGSVRLTDGEITADLLDDFDGQFTGVRGTADLSYAVSSGRTSLGRVDLSAEFSNGSVHLEGRPDELRLVADDVDLVHQVVKARLDADVGYSDGKLSGRVTLAEGAIDAVTAGFSAVPNIPDLAVDLTVGMGEGLTVVREESWARIDAGSEVRVLGSLKKPVFSGRIGLGAGELFVSGQTFAVVSGQALLEPGVEPEFALTLAEHVEGDDVLLTARGVLGDIELQLEDAVMPGADIPQSGDMLVKLIGSRVRQYILDQIAAWLDSAPRGPRAMAGTNSPEAN
ncbi:MAG: hypothetical protein BWY85_00919 [Firmicutes bacterium ADurb.Bin506]|nr:MAG: hypothetical protein BWY85_00919 [Firmicutes bacterium ADurb.Bin506]